MRRESLFRTRHISSEVVDHGELVKLATAETDTERTDIIARIILNTFDHYYFSSRYLPDLAKEAFERRDWGWSLELSQNRLALYSLSIEKVATRLVRSIPEIAESDTLWRGIEIVYFEQIRERYEADLALAFLHSVRRIVFKDQWRPVEYSFGAATQARARRPRTIIRTLPGSSEISAGLAAQILKVADLGPRFADFNGDAIRLAHHLNRILGLDGYKAAAISCIEMIEAGFYRNRGAYLIGRIRQHDDTLVPLAVALLNEKDGIIVDAVLTTQADVHNIFSSTLANFHATCSHYHELAAFLHTIMPRRPLGLHYSTIGFNHVGKVAVIRELETGLANAGERLGAAIGFPGTVAIGFSAPSAAYVLKVIRDHPTDQYKWGAYEGLDTVLKKYRAVHEINRTGSMLDNIIYTNVELDRSWFDAALLDEIVTMAGNTVSLVGSNVVFKHLIVQRKMVPLPVFLETAERDEAQTAVINLGYCIKNNAAANVFNRDLDGRNYGVSTYRKVYLFDYDALERLTDIKIDSNADRYDGEEDVPDWVFEDGFVFLPEELESGLRIDDRSLRRLFKRVHGDLLTVAYWQRLQADLSAGKVPSVSTYPDDRRIRRPKRV